MSWYQTKGSGILGVKVSLSKAHFLRGPSAEIPTWGLQCGTANWYLTIILLALTLLYQQPDNQDCLAGASACCFAKGACPYRGMNRKGLCGV